MRFSAPDLSQLVDAVRGAPVGVAIGSAEGQLLHTNPACQALFGWDPVTLHEGTGAERATRHEAVDTQIVELLARGDHRGCHELRRLDEGVIEVDWSCTVMRNSAGQTLYSIAYLQEVPEQTPELARNLWETRDTFEQAFANAPVGMALLDRTLCFRRVNPALARIFALSPAELLGRRYAEFLHPDDQAASENRLHQLHPQAMVETEVQRRMVDAAGRTLHVRMGASRITTLGQDLYFGVFVDVTAQREAETERAHLQEQVVHAERLRTLSQITGGIAHEVNNPAAIAAGGVELARRHISGITNGLRLGDLTMVRRHLERLEASLQFCEDGTARLANVARKLSSFSVLRGGAVEPVDVNSLARHAIELLRNDLRHRAELRVDLQPLPVLYAHAERLAQVLTNLLVNAAQAIAGPPANHVITLSTRSIAEGIEVVVADTGAGMSPATLERIFEPFYTTRRREEGGGLGLAVVVDVVRQHRGRIDVESKRGEGSRFTLTLPLHNGLGPCDTGTAPPVARARILIVDDEPALLVILGEILAVEHDVVTVGSGTDALALLETDTRFDALLCDLMMPGVDGLAVHRFLRNHAPALAARTVFATGGAFTARAAGYLSSHGGPVLVKPFTAEEVRNAMATVLAGPGREPPSGNAPGGGGSTLE